MAPESSPFEASLAICKDKMKKLQKKICKHRVGNKIQRAAARKKIKEHLIATIENKNLPDQIQKAIREGSFDAKSLRTLELGPKISFSTMSELVRKQEDEIKQLSSLNGDRQSASGLKSALQQKRRMIPNLPQEQEGDQSFDNFDENSWPSYEIIQSESMREQMGLKLRDSLFNF